MKRRGRFPFSDEAGSPGAFAPGLLSFSFYFFFH